ncbi:Bug family tripartite tricarboxylate transporter substrate binding protein [Bordetella genomosp. 4]|uniref:ABC transporter substrate-binding protein n=1 Tax=Bordetella genomosp. 4 TaxID=463044 RepID=A0A261USY9_9BORD|nr:tripartite tricarboxylate transporter substrate binding protein [Bordetella genomosp. 4]OZI64775.1 ABC transporter substrate-binding protein [Bordetella genomosp. 4]
MTLLRRKPLRRWARLAGISILIGATAAANAGEWPERPIRLLVPYGPGGSSDVVARAVAAEMSRDLGQQVIVENKGGGQGTIATTEVARANPDGYTLILGHVGTLAVNPSMMPKLNYDPRRDFAPIVLLAKLPMVFAVGGNVPAKTLPEFVQLARSKPGEINYGSAGNGSAGHLAFEMLKTAAKIDVVHVPYRGTGAQVNDLLAGNIDAAAAGTPGLLPHAQAGKIRIVAVGSAARLSVLPDVPTVAEQGYPGFESSQWFGLLAPAGTPDPVIKRLHQAAVHALDTDAVRNRLAHDASEPSGAGPAEFAAFIDAEEQRWGRVVKDAHLSIE